MESPKFQVTAEFVASHIPGFEVRYKNKSIKEKIKGFFLWPFCPGYMKRFTTTSYPRVYFPSKEYVEESPGRAIKILLHEFVHLYRRKRVGWTWGLLYAMPQALGLIIMLISPVFSVHGDSWGYAVSGAMLTTGLVFSLFAPCPFRRQEELWGYSMNMAVNFWEHGSVKASTINWITDVFVSWDYFKMFWFEDEAKIEIACQANLVKQSQYQEPFYLAEKFYKERIK